MAGTCSRRSSQQTFMQTGAACFFGANTSIDGAPPPLFAEIRECWRVWGNVTCDPSGHGVVGTITKSSKSELEHRHCYLCPLVAGLHRAFPLRAPASSFTCDCKITHLLYRKPLDFFSCHKNHNCFFSSSMSLTISHSGRRTAASEAHFPPLCCFCLDK